MVNPLFSVVVIAKDAALHLPRLLDSLGEFLRRGGEVLIGDGGSTDGTQDLAREAGCTVYQRNDQPIAVLDAVLAAAVNARFVVHGEAPVVAAGDTIWDCGELRNGVVARASCDVVINPDADEVFTVFDIDLLNDAVRSGAEMFNCNFVQAHDEHGAPSMKYQVTKMYDRRKLKFVGFAHETPMPMGEAKQAFVNENVMLLEHFQRENPDRLNGVLRQIAFDAYMHLDRARTSYYFGRQLYLTGRLQSAVREFERRAAIPGAWNTETAKGLILTGDVRLRSGERIAAMECYRRAFETDPTRREALLRMAYTAQECGDVVGVWICASGALQVPWDVSYGQRMTELREEPHALLTWACEKFKEKALQV